MELSSLIFKSDTSDLERVSKVIGDLVTDITKLDKVSRDAAKIEATLAKAAKDHASANLQNAKAQDVRLKTTITADKVDQQAATAIEKKTKATERATVAAKRNVDMLQLQNDTYDFILEGFSKGDAKVLAMAKATGQLSDQLKQVLTDIRQFSKNTFDQTETGLDRMVKSAKEASAAQGFLNQGFNLTAKQAKELGNDLDRLNIRLQHQGKSYDEIVKAQAVYKQQFLEEAKAVNQANNALATVEKQRKDVVSATNYMTQAEAKMAAALNTSNAALDKAGTDSLVKYETALRKSGVSQDVATAKLAKYKVQLAQVQEQEMKRREQHLTRAISPQLMDIGVSLYSGQNPMTVLIQQSGQLVDLFQLSGVEASKLGEAMRKSFYSMVPAIATVTKGLTNLFFGTFYDAGKGITNFIANVTGMNKVLQHTDDILYLIGGRVTWFSKILHTLGTIASVTFGTGVLAIVAGLAALAVGLKQVITENNDLAKAFALSGASIGLSHTQMIGYVKTLADSGATTGQATEALLAMAKAGNFTSSEILLVSDAAIQMQKGFGIAIEDTVKQFAKLKEKPVEALLEIAKSSGMVGPEVIKMVQELERAGKSTEAASVAMKAYANVTKQQVAQMKENYNGFALFMIDLGQKIKQFFSDTFKTLFLATDPNQQLQDQLVKLRERIKEVSGNLQSLGSFGDPKLLNQLKEQERMLISQISATVRIRGEEERRKYLNAENAKYESAIASLRGNALDAIEKETRKTQTLAEFRKSFIEDKLKDAAKEKGIDLEKLKRNTDLVNLLQQQADIEYKKIHKKDGKQAIKDLETEIDLRNKQLGLLGSFNNELAAIERRRKATGDEDQYQKSLNDLIKKQPIYLERQKEINAAHDLANKLMGKADMLGKDYYKTLEQIQEFQDSGLYSTEKAEALRKAAYSQTELAKQQLKYIEESTKLRIQYSEESKKSLDASSLENQKLDDRVALLGLTSEQQKYLKIQQQQRNSLLGVDLKLSTQIAKIWEDVRQGKLDPFDAMAAQLEAEKAAAEERKTINREVAVQYREDFQREFIDPIRNGLTDSIVTALFEGGKAGSKKVREVFTNIMRQKVTMVVDVAVNAFINNLVGSAANSLFGGGGGGLGGLSGLSNLWDMVSGGLNIAAVFGQKIAMQAGGWLANVGMETASQMVGQFGAGMMNTSSIGAFTSAFEAGGAQMAGAIAGSVLNGFAGYSISKLISGGYEVNKYVNKIAGIASMIPGIGPIAGVIGGGINRLFGRKLKESGIEGTFGGETGFEGRTYQFYKGGLFRSNKTKYGTLDEETRSNFAKSFFDMKSGVAEMAKILGVGAESLEDFTYKFKVNLKGLSEADATKKIQEQFKLMGEEMAKLVLSTDKYSLAGETRMDTLIRLSATLSTVNTIFENMGMTMYEMGLAGADAAYELTRLFGGLDQFKSSLSNYYEKFYSDSERQILLQSQLDRAFKGLGVSVPKTREEFRSLVEVQDLTTEGGRKLFTELMKLADGFDVLASQAEQLAEEIKSTKFDLTQRLLAAEGKDREALLLSRQQEIEAIRKLDPELVKILVRIYELEDASNAAVGAEKRRNDAIDRAYKALENAVKAEKDALNERVSIVQDSIKILDDLFKFLDKAVNDLYGQVTSTAAMSYRNARQYITQSYNVVTAGGAISDPTMLKESVDTAMQGLNSSDFATKQDYDRERLRLAAQLAVLRDSTKKSLTVEERILVELQDQIKQLDKTLEFWKKQIDISRGINDAVLSVAEAIRQLTNLLNPGAPDTSTPKPPSKSNDGYTGVQTPSSGASWQFGQGYKGEPEYFEQEYNLGRGRDFQDVTRDRVPFIKQVREMLQANYGSGTPEDLVRVAELAKAMGATQFDIGSALGFWQSDVRAIFEAAGIPAFADGGSYRGGVALVGETGPELINFNRPGYVHTAGETSGILASASSRMDSIEATNSKIIARLDDIAKNTRRSAEILRNVSPNGDSISVSES